MRYIFTVIGTVMLHAARGIADVNWRQPSRIRREWYIHPDIDLHLNPASIGVTVRRRNVRPEHGRIKYHPENRLTRKSGLSRVKASKEISVK